MYKPRQVLLKVVSRYLTEREFRAMLVALSEETNLKDSRFVEILQKHFDFERWQLSPLIKADILLYNYFEFEHKFRLKQTGLMRKYILDYFIYEDALFFREAERLNQKPISVPKGVSFEKNTESPYSSNHLLTDKSIPQRASA